MRTMRRAIFRSHDPFGGVELEGREIEMYGWYYDHPIFQQIISQLKPTKIIEVGSLYGASAIHMANLTKALGLDAEILCIDTFLGAPEYWEEATMPQLKLRSGFPRFYEQFMVNVLKSGLQDVITPFPLVSTLAAQVLSSQKIQADLIYIDAAHTYREALADIRAFWPLVRQGGVMFGDDFDVTWPGVIRAVHEWTEEEHLNLGRSTAMASTPTGSSSNTKWFVQKLAPAS
jgi:predicted O-methyltransferase YrrM